MFESCSLISFSEFENFWIKVAQMLSCLLCVAVAQEVKCSMPGSSSPKTQGHENRCDLKEQMSFESDCVRLQFNSKEEIKQMKEIQRKFKKKK